MAISRHSQNQIDLTDVATAWGAFEEINQVIVTIQVVRARRGANQEPQLIGEAKPNQLPGGEARLWACVSATSWVFSHRSLDSAVFHLLYTLDGLIASAELENAGK